METYHHGDLRQAVLAAAVDAITENGPGSINLRDLARRVGVSHAAPAHHFGDKAGLLTAVATEGFELLTEALVAAEPSNDLIEAGVAYVSFAIMQPAHFAVMFRPELYRADDPDLQSAQERSRAALGQAVQTLGERQRGTDPTRTAVAAWSFVHGFSTLWLQGALPEGIGDDPAAAARVVATGLFGPETSA